MPPSNPNPRKAYPQYAFAFHLFARLVLTQTICADHEHEICGLYPDSRAGKNPKRNTPQPFSSEKNPGVSY
jgi:hypothetical protein